VAASNFWVDPTHERPVHPLFLEFLADEAGFVEVETLFLHPMPAGFRGPDAVKELIGDLESLILGAGDLAVVARRCPRRSPNRSRARSSRSPSSASPAFRSSRWRRAGSTP
jgi:hypothetical protein